MLTLGPRASETHRNTAGVLPTLIVGNWKMCGSIATLADFFAAMPVNNTDAEIEIGVALPATLIAPAASIARGVPIGAQDVHPETAGAHTGGISAAMMGEAGARFTIVGHSECRDRSPAEHAAIYRKIASAREAGLTVILCVGESRDDRAAGHAEAVVLDQLHTALPDAIDGRWLSIAYEPLWAIGTGRIPRRDEIARMHRAIADHVAATVAPDGIAPRLLYGGSVVGGNAADLLDCDEIDGVLVGGASVTAARFLPIVRAAQQAATSHRPDRAA